MNSICLVGLGHVGLPTAVVLAAHGFRVIGVDTDPVIVSAVNTGKALLDEPGLPAQLERAVASGMLSAQGAPTTADAFVIAVPTPVAADKRPDLQHVIDAARSVAACLKKGNLVVVESTVPPGTTVNVVGPILEGAGLVVGRDFSLAYCPERVFPGDLMREIVENDRIVGGFDERSTKLASELYRSFTAGAIQETDATTAELVKLSENAYRDVNIALANEVAGIAESLGVDGRSVIAMANCHPRVGFHQPGPGVGGHCVPVDPWFLIDAAGDKAQMLRVAREINDAQPAAVVNRILRILTEVDEPVVALFGVAYKAGVPDARETPATGVIEGLQRAGVAVAVHDSHVRSYGHPLVSVEAAVDGADMVVFLTDHPEYRSLLPATIQPRMRGRWIFDTRDSVDHRRWEAAGFEVIRLGDGRAGA